jgi:hypothetical protein
MYNQCTWVKIRSRSSTLNPQSTKSLSGMLLVLSLFADSTTQHRGSRHKCTFVIDDCTIGLGQTNKVTASDSTIRSYHIIFENSRRLAWTMPPFDDFKWKQISDASMSMMMSLKRTRWLCCRRRSSDIDRHNALTTDQRRCSWITTMRSIFSGLRWLLLRRGFRHETKCPVW